MEIKRLDFKYWTSLVKNSLGEYLEITNDNVIIYIMGQLFVKSVTFVLILSGVWMNYYY